MKLDFYYTTTACSLASHIALEESGAAYQAHYVKLHGEPERAAYRAIVPTGKVPALSVDGTIVTENVAILSFVARCFPEARLMPTDPLGEALCLSLLGWFASTVHLDRRQAHVPGRFTSDVAAHAALAAAGSARFLADLDRIEAMLSGRDWLTGDRFSVADGYALVFWAWAKADGQPVDRFPDFAALAARVMARPAVRQVLERERHPLLDA